MSINWRSRKRRKRRREAIDGDDVDDGKEKKSSGCEWIKPNTWAGLTRKSSMVIGQESRGAGKMHRYF